MEVGAFILLLVLIAGVVAAAIVFGIAARLRRAKLDPAEDRLEDKLAGARDELRDGDAREGSRPVHVRAESDQRARIQSGR